MAAGNRDRAALAAAARAESDRKRLPVTIGNLDVLIVLFRYSAPRTEYQSQGGRLLFDGNTSTRRMPACSTHRPGPLQASFYMRNITDKRFPVLFQANAAGPGVHGELLNMPRQFGLDLKASF